MLCHQDLEVKSRLVFSDKARLHHISITIITIIRAAVTTVTVLIIHTAVNLATRYDWCG